MFASAASGCAAGAGEVEPLSTQVAELEAQRTMT
jgi:hypothetical protein